MLKKRLKAMFATASPDKVATYNHPVLGELCLNEDGEWWEVTVECHGDTFSFAIGGDQTPAPALVQHALDILGNYPDFKHMLTNFLRSEIKRFADDAYATEIKTLHLEQVCLCHPEEPENGMIYFKGSDESRVWRCDYRHRKPKVLGFDS